MGTIQREYVIVELDSFHKTEKIDDFVDSLPKEIKKLFFKSERVVNGYATYFMTWDGSKEGWETDLEVNKVRENFISIANSIDDDADIQPIKPTILHIFSKGDVIDGDVIERR